MSHRPSRKNAFLLCVLPLALTACNPKETRVLLQPSQALGVVLAEQTAQLAGAKKRIAVISPDANWGPTSTVEESFKAALQKQGCSVVTAKAANLGDPLPYAAASGLIGPEGGTLAIGPHTLTVPAGALAAPVTISADAPTDLLSSLT